MELPGVRHGLTRHLASREESLSLPCECIFDSGEPTLDALERCAHFGVALAIVYIPVFLIRGNEEGGDSRCEQRQERDPEQHHGTAYYAALDGVRHDVAIADGR